MIIGANSPAMGKSVPWCPLLGIVVVPVDTRSNFETAEKYAKQTNAKTNFQEPAPGSRI